MKTGTLLSKMKIALLFVLVAWSWDATAQFCIKPIITIQPLDNTVCVGGVSLFTVGAVGTNLSYQWQVNNGSGFTNCVNGGVYSGVLMSTLGVSASASMSGNEYRCVISNACGSAISNLCLMTIPSISALALPDVVCEGASVTLSGSGGVNYVWSTGATTPSVTVTPSSTTTYSLTGTTLTGCTSNTSVTVTVKPAPDVKVSASPSEICAGGSSTLTATGAEKYKWSTGETTPSITVAPGTTTEYSVTGTNSLGCSKTASVIVTVHPLPDVKASASPSSICTGASSVLTASGAKSYQWSTGESGATITVSPEATQNYLVTGTDEFGCSSSASVTVTVNPSPDVTATAEPTAICAGSSSSLVASGANSYVWSTGETQPNISVSPAETTTYQVTGTNDFGCSTTASITVVVNQPPQISVTASNPDICSGDFTFLTATGATNYVWSTGETGSRIGVSPTETTTYLVTGTDDNGCSASALFKITIGPVITATTSLSEMCIGEHAFLSASGATSYVWSTGETGPDIVVSPSQSTTYQVTGTDDKGCSATSSVTVVVRPPLSISVSASNPEICSGGFTFLTAAGATNYVWSTGETGESIGVSPTQTTTYLVTGTDDNGCSGSALFTITIGPVITATTTKSEMCLGDHAFLSASGATSYVWSTGETGPDIVVSPSQSTTYVVTGTDDKGCSATSSVTVVVGPPLSISVSASNPEICSGDFTFLTATGATNYVWSTGETGASIGVSPTQTTTYMVTGTDDKGCSGSAFFTITIGPVITATTTKSEMCLGDYAFLSASGATSYVWSTGETRPEIWVSPSQSTTYLVTGTNDDGCSASATVTVNVIDCSSSSGRKRTVQAGIPIQDDAIRPAIEDVSFSLYPNPTKGIFYIKGGPAGAITEVFNSMGQRVILGSIGEGTEINLTEYSNGIYLVKVKYQGTSIYNARVFKE